MVGYGKISLDIEKSPAQTARIGGLNMRSGIKAGYKYRNDQNNGTCYEYEKARGTCTECKYDNGSLYARYGPC